MFVTTRHIGLFLLCLLTMCLADIMLRRLVGWLLNNEFESIWTEAVAAQFEILFCLEGARKIMEYLIQDSQSPCRGLNGWPREVTMYKWNNL
jgi:hypothetical protein